MDQKWESLAITMTHHPSNGNWIIDFVRSADPEVKFRQGSNAFDAMQELGKKGWELVTGFNLLSDSRPNLVFKREIREG